MRVGTVCYCTEQGIGYLPKWFYDAGVITDVVLYHHSSRTNRREWYPPDTPYLAVRNLTQNDAVEDMVNAVDALLFFETPFDWDILKLAHEYGKRTYIVPMYECTPKHIPVEPTRWLCPSLLDQRDYFPGNPFLQIPVPPDTVWKRRTTARCFLHNGGHLGLHGHKGTLEIMRAMEHVKSSVNLTIAVQDEQGFEKLLRQVPGVANDDRVAIVRRGRHHDSLFAYGDVFVMAEKYNGLSLPLIEAWASGMCVVTSDRFPMNTWLPQKPLIPVTSYTTTHISGAYMEFSEATISPENIAAKIDELYGADISEYSEQGRAFAEANSWDKLKPVWMEELSK